MPVSKRLPSPFLLSELKACRPFRYNQEFDVTATDDCRRFNCDKKTGFGSNQQKYCPGCTNPYSRLQK